MTDSGIETLDGKLENKSGLFDIFEENSPRDQTVIITFPNGRKLAFRNYKNLEERRVIEADAKNEASAYYEQSRKEEGPWTQFKDLESADFIAAVVLSHLCLGEVGEDGIPDGTGTLDEWMKAAVRNTTLFAWVIRQIDLAMFGLLRSAQVEELDAAKKE